MNEEKSPYSGIPSAGQKNLDEKKEPDSYWDRPFDESPLNEHGKPKLTEEELEKGAEKGNDEKKPKKVDINKYKDLGGVTLRKLSIGLWYVEHKIQLRKLLISLLLFVSAISWSYTIYGFAYYFSRGMAEDRLLAEQLVHSGIINHEAVLSASAKDLIISPVSVITTNKKFDFYTKITNPNQQHGAQFIYYFLTPEGETEKSNQFILPGESKYLISLSNEYNFKPSGVQLKFENYSWKKVKRHEIPDWKKYRDGRINITVSDKEFVSAAESGLSDKIKLNHLEFNVENESIYNYWSIDFIILLYSGSSIVGVNKYTIDEFLSGEVRSADMSWPGAISRVSKIEIKPEINIFKDDIYIKYEGGVGEEK